MREINRMVCATKACGCSMNEIVLQHEAWETEILMNTGSTKLPGAFGGAKGPKARSQMLTVRSLSLVLATVMAVAPQAALPQTMMSASSGGGGARLLSSDSSILEIEDIKKDLPCTVTSIKPVLGFDLRFHSGYDITLPLSELSGEGGSLTILLKVTSATAKDSPIYFSQRYSVPNIEEDAKGEALLQGSFDIGEGDYRVMWMMRDKLERVCSSAWDISATLPAKDQSMTLPISAHAIEASNLEFFKDEPPVTRIEGPETLKVKILINFAPQKANAATMAPVDTSALVSILRNIAREPRIYKFSLVAFNMNEQKVVYRKEDMDQINFPELGKALSGIKLGMVDYRKLVDKKSETEFLTRLIQDELGNNSTDAVIFAGPKVMLDYPVPAETFHDISDIAFPVFYMNYILTPQQTPWRDSIGTVVKKLKGLEYTISRPRDLWNAWSDIMGRIVKTKLVATAATSDK